MIRSMSDMEIFRQLTREDGIIAFENPAEMVRFRPPLKPQPEVYLCTRFYV